MNLFIGSPKPNDSIAGDTTVNWTADTTKVTRRQDSFGSTFQFGLDSFTYINCDYFSSQTPLTNLSIKMHSDFVDTTGAVFLYFPTINSVTKAFVYDKSTNSYSLGTYYKVPEGLSVKILFVGKKGTQLYYEIKSATITTNYTTTISLPIPVTEAQLKLIIKGM